VLCTSAAHMLGELAGADGDNALRHRLSVYARPHQQFPFKCNSPFNNIQKSEEFIVAYNNPSTEIS